MTTVSAGRVQASAAGSAAGIALEGIRFGYAAATILDDVSLNIAAGEFFTLIGPSGCGKTTILRLVAGLLTPNRGTIRIGERDVTDVPTHRRGIGLVFQNYALFPHMTIAENVAYGLRMQGATRDRQAAAIDAALKLVGMSGVEKRFPGELSGGQQQRIGLARAIAAEPKVMLLDEPLSNLDAKLREQMCVEIAELQRRLKVTVLYVTHDQGEALAMSDRVAVMNKGRIQEIGDARSVYERPETLFGAGFVGKTNIFELSRTDAFRTVRGARVVLSAEPDRAEVLAMVRPEAVRLSAGAPGPDGDNRFPGVVSARVYRGAFDELMVAVEGFSEPMQALAMASERFAEGQQVSVSIAPQDIHLLRRGEAP
jgi:ABC-type Fe3+/spermidine/putrescine transport system ATPase subunit